MYSPLVEHVYGFNIYNGYCSNGKPVGSREVAVCMQSWVHTDKPLSRLAEKPWSSFVVTLSNCYVVLFFENV